MYVYLNSIETINNFVKLISKFDDNIDLISGRYVVDAKSILGIFSLDLSKPLKLEVNNSENEECIIKMLHEFEAISL